VTTRGVIYVHAAPAALTPHLEWAVAGVLDPDELGPDGPGPADSSFEAIRPASRTPLADRSAPHERGHGSAFVWTDQPAEPGTLRAEIVWEGPAGTAGRIASALRGWPRLRFEVTEDASHGAEGERYAWTPKQGMFRATVGVNGDILVGEDRLRAAMAEAAGADVDLAETLESLMGQPWDEELEPFRYAGEGAPVRILHHVI
jgi:hypothetical protein